MPDSLYILKRSVGNWGPPKPMRILIAATALFLVAPMALSAAVPTISAGPQPIYAAVSLLQTGRLTTKRCGEYTVMSGTYSGRSSSPDPRLAGVVRYTGRVSLARGSTSGVANGQLTIRDARNRVRMRGTISGVVTQSTVVNGLVTGTLVAPGALILANVTIVFDDALSFAAVRLGLESGANSAVAYPAVPKC